MSRSGRSASRRERRCGKCPECSGQFGYLSEVERGQKEASSELLAAICAALDLPLSVVLNVVSEKMASYERVTALPNVRAMAQAAA